MLRRMQAAALMAIGAAMVMSGCQTTRLVSEWSNPAAAPVDLDRILVIALTGDQSTRRIAEDQIVKKLPGATAVPSYTVLAENELSDVELLRRRVQAEGFDGVVLMRVVSVEEVPEYDAYGYTSGFAPYGNFYGYYGYAYPMTYPYGFAGPGYGYVGTETYVRVETTVHALERGEDTLIWSGLTRSVDPGSISGMTDEIAEIVGRELTQAGFLS